MRIEYLADRPEAVATLAQWQHQEWGHLRPGDTIEQRYVRIRGAMNRDRVPLTVVALEEDQVLGSASLILHDMDTRMELTPWLASVFVGEHFRRRGIGAELVRRIMLEAGKLKMPLVYLYTVHSEKFYASLGWKVSERTAYRHQKVVIMTYRPAL
ncbi:MAG TPA: GNAT family N-acetyltransferase [Chthoniobacterales bacterium]|jgi:N-acetylglutamate synthase-like GNAT family acetyltransferase